MCSLTSFTVEGVHALLLRPWFHCRQGFRCFRLMFFFFMCASMFSPHDGSRFATHACRVSTISLQMLTFFGRILSLTRSQACAPSLCSALTALNREKAPSEHILAFSHFPPGYPPPLSLLKSLLHPVHLHRAARSGACRAGEAEVSQRGAVPPDARDRRLPGVHRLFLRPSRPRVRLRGEQGESHQEHRLRIASHACGQMYATSLPCVSSAAHAFPRLFKAWGEACVREANASPWRCFFNT